MENQKKLQDESIGQSDLRKFQEICLKSIEVDKKIPRNMFEVDRS